MSKKNFNIRINYILSVFLSFMITLSFFTAQVNAQNQPSEIKQPTEAQLTKIQTECSSIKSHLKKLRSNDALMRVNLGQNYETISSRLMAKLNGVILPPIRVVNLMPYLICRVMSVSLYEHSCTKWWRVINRYALSVS